MGRWAAVAASVGVGVSLELVVGALSGRREAWDSEQYWTSGLPAALFAAVLIGLFSRGREWLWTALILPSQVTAMMIRTGGIGTLWPLMLVLSSILGGPFVAAAFLGAVLRRSQSR